MRRYYLDNVRFLTVILVVIYHIIYMYNGVQPFGVIGAFRDLQIQDGYMYLVYPWFMALLFVISGMGARFYLEKHTDREFINARTGKLLIPSTLALFVFWWILGYYNMLIGGAFETMALPQEIPTPVRNVILYIIMSISGSGPLWFIQVLWVFSVLLVLVRKIEKDRLYNIGGKMGIAGLLVCTVICFFMAQILNTPIITVYRFGIYGFCFFMGYFVFSHDEVIERICRFRIALAAGAIILGIAYTVIYFGENYAVEPVINNICATSYCWIAILAILSCAKTWWDKDSSFTNFWKSRTWGLYIFHYLPIAVSAWYLKVYAPECPAIICYIVITIAAFAGALLLNKVISSIPFLRWCVLGIKKDKK